MVFSRILAVSFFGASLIGSVSAQADETECDNGGYYDTSTGTATCGGIDVNVFDLVCGGGFSQDNCVASWTNGGGNQEEYFFMGAGDGIDAQDLPQSCYDGFQDTGLAMIQYYPDNGGCFPAADLSGTTMTYTPGGNGIQSISLNFAAHTYQGAERDGYIKVTCSDTQGPWQTDGDSAESSKYEVYISAPCGTSGPPPPPPPTTPSPSPPGPSPPTTQSPSPPGPPGPPTQTQHQKKGISNGDIMSIVFFVALFGYLGGGYVFLWKVKHKEGHMERIPNKSFWASLPGLVKDGFLFTKAKIMKQPYQKL